MSEWAVGQEIVHYANHLDETFVVLHKCGVKFPQFGPGHIVELGWLYHVLVEFPDGTRDLCLKSCLRLEEPPAV